MMMIKIGLAAGSCKTSLSLQELHGQETFKDGEDKSRIIIKLPKTPQDVDMEKFR